MNLVFYSMIIIVTSLCIYYLGNIFSSASSKIGEYLNLSKSVKGATFDAVAGSMPELMVALFSVIFFQKFEVGIGTISGSALFNLLIIPGICVLVSPKIFRISKEVLTRDALFYIISEFTLLVLILNYPTWGLIISSILILIYFIYVKRIVVDTKKTHKLLKVRTIQKINIKKESAIFLSTMFLMGFATYFLTEAAIKVSEILNISPVIVAFTIIASATSIPDTVISYINAKKGNIDDAMSNVFGSNIFDILIGLGLPLLIYNIIKGPVSISFDYLEIVLGLHGATIMLFYFLIQEDRLKKSEGILLLALYLIFVIYVVTL